MCLAVPMKIISKSTDYGVVEVGNTTYEVNLVLLPDAEVGDYVLIHAGFAIQRLDLQDANERLELFREMEKIGC